MKDIRRVVVTGLGVVSPLGVGTEHVWKRLINGESGLTNIFSFDASGLPSQVAGEVPLGSYSENKFDQLDWVSFKEVRRTDKFIVYSLAAAQQAVEDSGIHELEPETLIRVGVSVGSGIGGLQKLEDAAQLINANEYNKISPFFIPSSLVNLASGWVSIKYGFKGPNISIATACASGAHSIGDSCLMIKNGQADIMIAGGTESATCPVGVAGFCRMGALSTKFNDEPTKASRPWDKDRDGFVISEGAAVLVLEELEHARKRGAKIYAEVVGYGMSGDASHITAPSGEGAVICMNAALNSAGLKPNDIDYINAHGTSTPLGDEMEIKAIKQVFGQGSKIPLVSSTKGATGHLLGAAGALEAVFSVKACANDIVPATLNLDNPSEACDIDLVPHKARDLEVNYVLSNSFGFGGTNASLIFKKFKS